MSLWPSRMFMLGRSGRLARKQKSERTFARATTFTKFLFSSKPLRLKSPLLNVLCLLVLLTCMNFWLVGCSKKGGEGEAPEKVVYYCLQTHKIYKLPPQKEIPAPNPQTGKKTLVPAYKDPKTGHWRPIKQALPH